MARVVLKAGNSLRRKRPKTDKKLLILFILNLLLNGIVLLKLFGVI